MRTGAKSFSPASAIGVVALVLAMGGAAYAGSKVDSADLARGSVTAPKLAKSSVTTSKIEDNAVTGQKVDEATLGAVPTVAGRETFFQPLTSGQSVEIARVGRITLIAHCAQGGPAGTDQVSITARTAQDGAVLDGTDDHDGTSSFLDVATPEPDAELVYNSAPSGAVNVDNDADEGFVIGPDGKGFSIDGDEMRLGLNYLGVPCFVSGVLTQIG